MRCGVPTVGERVAPRCIYADGLLLLDVEEGEITTRRHDAFPIRTPADLTAAIESNRVETLISGGVSQRVRVLLDEVGVRIVDNISTSLEELVERIESGGLVMGRARTSEVGDESSSGCPFLASGELSSAGAPEADCLGCRHRSCLSARAESAAPAGRRVSALRGERRMFEAALDISKESPRRLCRLAEVVYFCIEMEYRRIGLAYCVELEDAARILKGVLERFFEVVPVCCKVGGLREIDVVPDAMPWVDRGATTVACNPWGQAKALERAGTQFNLAVGLCVGVDAIFARASHAPASVLFVKDKSLANNPIGALYSEYHLMESASQGAGRRGGVSGARAAAAERTGRETTIDEREEA